MIFDWLSILLPAAAGIATFVWWIKEAIDWGEFLPIILGIFIAPLIAGMTLLAVVGMDWGLSNLTHPETIYQNVPLANLQDSIQTTGSYSGGFFLGFGTLNGTLTYGFYTNNNGAYQFHAVDATGVNVYQDTTKPYAVQNVDCKMRKLRWLLDCVDASSDDYVAFHVPKGTIKINYNLDAKN